MIEILSIKRGMRLRDQAYLVEGIRFSLSEKSDPLENAIAVTRTNNEM